MSNSQEEMTDEQKNMCIKFRRECMQRDYAKLQQKYDIASRHLEEEPDKYGGEELIRGYLSGLIDGMVLLNPNLVSVVMD